MTKARPRTELQKLLEDILGSEYVYFQPPVSMQLHYPCIVYERNTYVPRFANNETYIRRTRFTIKLITKDPDSPFAEALEDIPYCSHTRNYIVDNLVHDIYDLYW